jgi:hypothetical protein
MAGTKTYAKAVDFDGTNDYLSRASDFTGNADGKTFTFSVWVWEAANTNDGEIYTTSDQSISVSLNSNSQLLVKCYDAALSGVKLWFTLPSNEIPRYGFTHILFSVDMSDTGKRYLYINDVAFTPTWNAYVDSTLGFAKPAHYVGAGAGPARLLDTRLSNVFLDYTYRDLSNVTNRRLFITADRKPAQGQAALNPILYLPMDDPTTAHINQGTGGNFTLNGVVARSGRGPNQYNVAYSDLDGAADYLQRSSLIGVNDGAAMTASFVINADNYNGHPFCIEQAGAVRVQFWYESETSLRIVLRNSSATILLNATAITKNHILRNTIVTVAFDLSDTAKRHIYCNGEAASVTWATYTNGSVNFSGNQVVVGARADGVSNFFNGRLGNLYFNTTYIDLSVASNLAKFVTGTGIDAKPADLGANGELPTGTAPLIYLPMYGNNAGKNYGTGGDFTVNSGPYPGARGPNEFWGNKADFDGTTGYLARTSALTGVSDGKTFSCSFTVNIDVNATRYIFLIANGASERLRISWSSSTPTLDIAGTDSGGSSRLYATCGTTLSAGTQYSVQICIDLANTSNRKIYINGLLDSTTWTTYTNSAIELSAPNQRIGIDAGTTGKLDGKLSEFYFTTTYIDFSQEANRLLFRDAFGNPTDLPSLIESGAVPNPAVYMRFDPANQGLNSGTGGNFTKSGTITDGGQL